MWSMPGESTINDDLGARATRGFVKNEAEAEEVLRTWSARPVDVLLLGPGFPQSAWQKLNLPHVDKRLIFALNPTIKAPVQSPWVSLKIDQNKVKEFVEHVCALHLSHPGCRVESLDGPLPWKLKNVVPQSKNVVFVGALKNAVLERQSEFTAGTLFVGINWPMVLRHILNHYRKTDGTARAAELPLDFHSAFLSVESISGALPNDQKIVGQFLENWTLQELASPL